MRKSTKPIVKPGTDLFAVKRQQGWKCVSYKNVVIVQKKAMLG
jgi:hypothetical protein